MADKLPNPVLNQKRLELRRHEQLLAMRRQELRILELEDEMQKTKESLENTKRIVSDIEKELTESGIEF